MNCIVYKIVKLSQNWHFYKKNDHTYQSSWIKVCKQFVVFSIYIFVYNQKHYCTTIKYVHTIYFIKGSFLSNQKVYDKKIIMTSWCKTMLQVWQESMWDNRRNEKIEIRMTRSEQMIHVWWTFRCVVLYILWSHNGVTLLMFMLILIQWVSEWLSQQEKRSWLIRIYK